MFFNRKHNRKERKEMAFSVDLKNVTIDGNKIIIDCGDINPASLFGGVRLSSIEVGKKFTIGDETFIMLEKVNDGKAARVIRADFLPDYQKFGSNNNWKVSPIRTDLNGGSYYKKIAALVGKDNIIEMERDLTSLDGLDDYGTCIDKISLLSAAEYAKYHKILGVMSNYPTTHWTITAFSTPSNDYSGDVCYVNSFGVLCWSGCDWGYGVRPFLTLDTSILVSCEK